ncbi:MAG: hypothetical protein ABIF77_09105 [bacterium]
MGRIIRWFLFLIAVAAGSGLCFFVQSVANGAGYLLGAALLVIFAITAKRFGLADAVGSHGFLYSYLAWVLGGTYLIANRSSVLLGVIWLVVWLAMGFFLRRQIVATFFPLGHLADQFAKTMGWQPTVSRDLPSGCFTCGISIVLFFLFFMVFGLNGLPMWVVQMAMLLWFRRRVQQGKGRTGMTVLGLVITSVFVQIMLFTVLDAVNFPGLFGSSP